MSQVYSYVALNSRRKEERGQIEASSEREAAAQLRKQGLQVTRIQVGEMPVGIAQTLWKGIKALHPNSWRQGKKQDYIRLYRQLHLMLRSGHTLLESLDLAARLAPRKAMGKQLLEIHSRIQRGQSFAHALSSYPKQFPLQAVELIRSAEASGELDVILLRIADDTEHSMAMKRQIGTAMIYPSIVLMFTVVIVLLLATWVLPKLESFIVGKGLPVPDSTAMIIEASHFLTDNGVYLLAAIGGGIFAILASYTHPVGKRLIDRILINLPLVGGIIRSASIARVGWTMSILSASGINLLQGLKICADITGNESLKASLRNSANEVLKGESLANALKQPHIPKLFHEMAAVGEKSGEIDNVMLELGRFFNDELEIFLKRMVAMIGPVMLLMVGMPVAFIYLSIFQLVFSASTGGR